MRGVVEWQIQHKAKPCAVFCTSRVNSALIVLRRED